MGVRMNIHMLKSTQPISQAILQEMAILEAEGSISNSRPQTTIQQPRKRRTPMSLHQLLSQIKLLTRHHPHIHNNNPQQAKLNSNRRITITTTNTKPPDYSYYKLPYHKADRFGRGSHCYLYSEPDLNKSNPKTVFDNYVASQKKMETPSPDLFLPSNGNTPTCALNRLKHILLELQGSKSLRRGGATILAQRRVPAQTIIPQNQTTTWQSPTLNQIRGQIGPHPAGPSLGQKQPTEPPQTPKSRLTSVFDSLVTIPNLIKIRYSLYQCTCSIHRWGGDYWR
ncbi:hypothetical protein BDR26DRAFT_852073 [Obelidium mucronatum]|nr:hypothetical protein BDR26DRAFT_852073 [Obelidium mucronatum]